MLKQKRYEENDIVTVVLTGGQELLGKFVSESGDYFIIKKPLTLMYGQKISFQPFTVTGDSEGEVVLHRDKIVSILLRYLSLIHWMTNWFGAYNVIWPPSSCA